MTSRYIHPQWLIYFWQRKSCYWMLFLSKRKSLSCTLGSRVNTFLWCMEFVVSWLSQVQREQEPHFLFQNCLRNNLSVWELKWFKICSRKYIFDFRRGTIGYLRWLSWCHKQILNANGLKFSGSPTFTLINVKHISFVKRHKILVICPSDNLKCLKSPSTTNQKWQVKDC